MKRLLVVLLATSLLGGCAPIFTKTPRGWHLSAASYRVIPTAGGNLGPEGWAITNYVRRDKGELRKTRSSDEFDLLLERKADDGIAWLNRVEVESTNKRLSTFVDRAVRELQRASFVRRFVGGGTVIIPYDVQVVVESEFAVPGGEGFELVAETTRAGSSQVDSLIYLALMRQPNSRELVRVGYVNRPRTFHEGLGDIRALARRVAFGDAEPLPPAELTPLTPSTKLETAALGR